MYSHDGSSILSCDDEGNLCLSDASDRYRVARTVSHAVRTVDKELSPISPSPDGQHIVYVGPTEFLITILDVGSFQETLKIEMSNCGRMTDKQSSSESARFARFAPNRHVFVATSKFNLMRFDSYTGKLLSVVKMSLLTFCSILAVPMFVDRSRARTVDRQSRSLLEESIPGYCRRRYAEILGCPLSRVGCWRAGKYHWLLSCTSSIAVQSFLGHSARVRKLFFIENNMQMVSIGDAILVWDVLAWTTPPISMPK